MINKKAAHLINYFRQSGLPAPMLKPIPLMYLLYLTDWKSAITHGTTLTHCRWDRVGPGIFSANLLITSRDVPQRIPELSPAEEATAHFVATVAQRLSEPDLIKLVASTYPVLMTATGTSPDLVTCAAEYTKLSANDFALAI